MRLSWHLPLLHRSNFDHFSQCRTLVTFTPTPALKKGLEKTQSWDACASCWYWPVGQTEELGASYAAPSPGARGSLLLSCPYVSLFVPANPQRGPRPVGGIRAGHAYAFPYAPYLHLSCALHTQTSCCGWQLLHQWGHTYKIIKQSFLCYF